ncbi:MAG TPA: hypothetical protein VEX62_02615, partial [Candidatus Limnocylindrales bacterium]|nr:hypothetical protein [Candidatus Limnocylindrales bacterium]
MSRLLLTLSLTAAMFVGAGGVAAGRVVTDGLISGLPSVATTDTSSAFALKLPAGAAAVEGRVYLDTSAAEVIGIAPSGKGTALEPVEIQGGYAFAAYGLSGDTLNIVIAAKTAGRLELRVVVDAAADASGKRLAVARPRALATVSVDRGAAALSAPRELPRRAPSAAAVATRDLVADGTVGKLDLDTVRAAWGQARSSADQCIAPDASGDANADG